MVRRFKIILFPLLFLLVAVLIPFVLFAASSANFTLEILPSTNAGSNGGGGGGVGPSGSSALFYGKAYPYEKVYLLKDGELIDETVANVAADFSFDLANITPGIYTFSIYSYDVNGLQSVLYTVTLNLSNSSNIAIDDILLPPSITTNKQEVISPEMVKVSGQTLPYGEVSVFFRGDVYRTTTDGNGLYSVNLPTSELQKGLYDVTATSTGEGFISTVSKTVTFEVGDESIVALNDGCPQKADLNGDCRVNIIDFSIAAFWYERELSNDFIQDEDDQLTGDTLLDLRDFSLMAYYWTG